MLIYAFASAGFFVFLLLRLFPFHGQLFCFLFKCIHFMRMQSFVELTSKIVCITPTHTYVGCIYIYIYKCINSFTDILARKSHNCFSSALFTIISSGPVQFSVRFGFLFFWYIITHTHIIHQLFSLQCESIEYENVLTFKNNNTNKLVVLWNWIFYGSRIRCKMIE